MYIYVHTHTHTYIHASSSVYVYTHTQGGFAPNYLLMHVCTHTHAHTQHTLTLTHTRTHAGWVRAEHPGQQGGSAGILHAYIHTYRLLGSRRTSRTTRRVCRDI
jgi:hypothetical protein